MSRSSASQASALSGVRGWAFAAESASLSVVRGAATTAAAMGEGATLAAAGNVEPQADGLVAGGKEDSSTVRASLDIDGMGGGVVQGGCLTVLWAVRVATQANGACGGRTRCTREKKRREVPGVS